MSYPRSPLVCSGILGLGAILLFYLYLMLSVAHVEADNSTFQESALSDCIERYRPLVNVVNVDVLLANQVEQQVERPVINLTDHDREWKGRVDVLPTLLRRT